MNSPKPRGADDPTPVQENADALDVGFGQYVDLPGLRQIDWQAFAENTEKRIQITLDVLDRQSKGLEFNDLSEAEARAEHDAARVIMPLIGKIETEHTPGQYTHPIVLTNLYAAMLERAACPINDEQRHQLQRLGQGFEDRWEIARAAYNDATPNLLRLIEELEFKQQWVQDLRGLLSDTQHATLFDERYRDLQCLDPISPVFTACRLARGCFHASAECARHDFQRHLVEFFDLTCVRTELLTEALDYWFSAVQSIRDPIPWVTHISCPQLLVAGQAQAELQAGLGTLPECGKKLKSQLRRHNCWIVPQVADSLRAE